MQSWVHGKLWSRLIIALTSDVFAWSFRCSLTKHRPLTCAFYSTGWQDFNPLQSSVLSVKLVPNCLQINKTLLQWLESRWSRLSFIGFHFPYYCINIWVAQSSSCLAVRRSGVWILAWGVFLHGVHQFFQFKPVLWLSPIDQKHDCEVNWSL